MEQGDDISKEQADIDKEIPILSEHTFRRTENLPTDKSKNPKANKQNKSDQNNPANFFETIKIVNELRRIESSISITDRITIEDASHRRKISSSVINAFIIVNIAILIIISCIFSAETYIIMNGIDNYTRVVDAKTIMTLIGATTVQFGAIALAVSNWLFPKSPKNQKP